MYEYNFVNKETYRYLLSKWRNEWTIEFWFHIVLASSANYYLPKSEYNFILFPEESLLLLVPPNTPSFFQYQKDQSSTTWHKITATENR